MHLQAMRREGHRCILSRFIDAPYYMERGRRFFENAPPCESTSLELCHIFSESTNAGLQNAAKVSFLLIIHTEPAPTLLSA